MKVARLLPLLLLLFAGIAAYFVLVPCGSSSEVFVDIPAGTGAAGIAVRLERAGVIRSHYAFEIMRRYRGGVLRAGEYRFVHPATLGEVYSRVARGDVYTIALMIPEGFNTFDIAQAVQNAGLGKAPNFLAAERRDVHLIADLNPQATSLEGYLFPDTYRFSRQATAEQMLAAMVRRFRQAAIQLGLPAPPALAPIVTMASLIEKEVRIDAERPLVAGVFTNRLASRMPLATDPSVIYAALLEGRWRGTIYQSDLNSASPYNTYRHTGLPPGPVANPGVAALRAALKPTKTPYLFFVADASGHSQFSATLEEHARRVKDYRDSQRVHP